MVIDFHCHIGRDKDGTVGHPSDLLKHMKNAGIDYSVIFPFDEKYPGSCFSNANERIYKIMKKTRRFVGFMRLNPNCERRILINEIEKNVKRKFKGIKLHPRSQSFRIISKEVNVICKLAEKYELPILMHTDARIGYEKNSNPLKLAKLAEKFPKVKFIAAHMGYFIPQFLKKARKLKNLYIDTAIISSPRILEIVSEICGYKKILFGSDYSYSYPEIEKSKIVMSKLSESKKEYILEKNAKRVLNL